MIVTPESHAKMAEPIEMPRRWGRILCAKRTVVLNMGSLYIDATCQIPIN